MMNVAIIGVSGFGAVHYKDFEREHAAGRIKILGATVINQAEEAEKCDFLRSVGCELFTDYRAMLDKLRGRIDLCFIPTGIALHAEMTIAALESGANVFVEKPVAPTVQETDAMKEAEKRTDKFVTVGYQTMFQPETRRIKELLLSGAIGEAHTFSCYALWPRGDRYYGRNNWAGKMAVNGKWVLDSPFTNALAHYLNLLSFYAGGTFAGTIDPVEVQAGLFRANPIETDDIASIRVTGSRGERLFFHVTHVSEGTANPVIRIEGTGGVIEYDENKTVVRRADNSVIEEFPTTTWEPMRINIYNKLIKRLQDPGEFVCTLDIAAMHTLITNAVFDSVRNLPIPPEAVTKGNDAEGSSRLIVPGIDAALRRAFAENRLLGTEDFAWAEPGKPFPMKDYHNFLGTYA